jgi:7-cyano-7-deazaguanine synthase in queuosine biosynthesis
MTTDEIEKMRMLLETLFEHSCYDGPKDEQDCPGPCPSCVQTLLDFRNAALEEAARALPSPAIMDSTRERIRALKIGEK